MNKKLLQLLVCPLCKGELRYNRKKAGLECSHDNLLYPVRNGVPVLLEMDASQLLSENK
jgi:uncharacterized protein YbaR (Trm112 family)